MTTTATPVVPVVNMERQATLNLKLPKAVAVVGCGGVGAWVAMLLAFAGVPKLYLFDNDNVSDHNLNRLPLNSADIGKLKSEAIADAIRVFRPQCDIMALRTFTHDAANTLELWKECTYIIATTDTLKSRQMVHEWAATNGINYQEVAAEGDFGTVAGSPADFATVDEENPGYASVPVWIGPCITAAAVAVSYIIHERTVTRDQVLRMGFELKPSTKSLLGIPKFTFYDSNVAMRREKKKKALLAKANAASKPRSR